MLYDVLVIGSGIAGISAALEAHNFGLKIAIMTKSNPLRSNSSMASGGINAALGTMENDSIQEHINDTIKGGAGLSYQKSVEILCKSAPNAIKELLELGVEFDKKESGELMQRSFGGARKKRTCYVADKTGGAIVQALLMATKKTNIIWLRDYQVLSILHNKDRVCGISALKKSDSTVAIFAAKSIILAGGGYAGIYKGYTSNPPETSGDMIALALKAGLSVSNLEFVQFHPTGLAKSGSLVSEAVRGEGGYLVNEKGERFVNELETRDKVALAVFNQIKEGHRVFIDVRHLKEEIIDKKLPSFKRAALNSEGVDPTKELIPIKPVAHYTMGGIDTDHRTKTSLKGLFAAGECANNGCHGANRLGGNSLLEAYVFGKIAGEEAARFAKEKDFLEINLEQVSKDVNLVEYILEGENRYNINAIKTSLGKVLFENVGLIRSKESLQKAFSYIKYLRSLSGGLCCVNKNRDYNVELSAILELKNALNVAEALTLCALAREESRGAHVRSDFPQKNDKEFKKESLAKQLSSNGLLKVEFSNRESRFSYFERFKNFLKGGN